MSTGRQEVGLVFARNCARRFVSIQLLSLEMPEWPYEQGLFRRDDVMAQKAFLDELTRLARDADKKISHPMKRRLAEVLGQGGAGS